MKKNKLKSFTLSELLIVMIITAIVVGMGFSVLRLVQRQITSIRNNFEKTSELSLFEQKLWQDFNEHDQINLFQKQNSLRMESALDTVVYNFQENLILRNTDTIKLRVALTKGFFEGRLIQEGDIDALSLSVDSELPDYTIFVSKKNDITYFMNQDGI